MLKKIKHKYGALLLLALLLAQPTWLGANNNPDNPSYVTINSSKLTRDSILIGDQVTWSTNFTVNGNNSLEVIPYTESVANDSSKIEVLRGIELDTVAIKEGIAELEAKLLFTYFDSGYFRVPKAHLLSSSGDTIVLDAPSIAVNTIQIDTASFKMYDIKSNLVEYPVTFKEVYPWVLIALAILLFIYILYRFIKNKRENGSLFGKPVVKDPPHIVALRELDKLRTQKLWKEGKEKLFYTSVTDALRAYIEGRYNISAMEKTSAEILGDLSDKKIEAKPYNELNDLFQLADLVKFAKYTPQEVESEEIIPKAVRFVNATFMQEMVEEIELKEQADASVVSNNKEEK